MAKVMCQFQDFAILEVSYEPLKVFDLVFKHLHCHLYHHNYLSTKFQVKIHNFRGWLKLSAGHITLPAAKKAPSRGNFSKILLVPLGGMLVLAIQQVSKQNIEWLKLCDFSVFGT